MMFSEKTNGFIKKMINEAGVSPDHRMFLISTIYMKAKVNRTGAILGLFFIDIRWTLMKASWTVKASTSEEHELFCFKKDSSSDCTRDFKWLFLNNVYMVCEKTKSSTWDKKYILALCKNCCWWSSYRHLWSSIL